MSFTDQLAACRVLPVITAYDESSTQKLAEALARGGMSCIEITLRTDAGLGSIRAVKEAMPDLLVAAGTVTRAAQVAEVGEAGADFCVSPGISEPLLTAAASAGMPFLPGVSTTSDVMLGLEHGLEVFKFFPAAAAGGIDMLRAFQGPFPDVRFCPTGGLGPANFRNYLALPNVICCGGSWMVSMELVSGGRWGEIEDLAREAVSTRH
jgi:2-dehydro-3-deoxyphosphogluconate aldolase/(4S)-4-hydroxy-2-oxoglutarate aldolase